MTIWEERNIGLCSVGGKGMGDAETVENENVQLVIECKIICQGILSLEISSNFLAAYVYVAFRCEHPDEETKKDVKEALKKYNLDFNKLVNWWPGNCHHAVS
jgi:hypothetical protein